ncbi:2Fe-2S iron-sulfur cluster-binding protein [Dongshaea marina]|uniref:2Fe-2S iron-sulfur cluster-binding protein n=1 Tax=Dongshaea marina TaxID=2047966 RepID=UPI00190253C1|nr:2Fe-2S iron-sulfur cluster-binding protein [Dongshaea marina]
MALYSLLRDNPTADEQQIREGISGNLCRCTGYGMIIEAAQIALADGGGLWNS